MKAPEFTGEPCTTCGAPVDINPTVQAAKAKFGRPLTLPLRCSKCIWTSLADFATSPDEEKEGARHESGGSRTPLLADARSSITCPTRGDREDERSTGEAPNVVTTAPNVAAEALNIPRKP